MADEELPQIEVEGEGHAEEKVNVDDKREEYAREGDKKWLPGEGYKKYALKGEFEEEWGPGEYGEGGKIMFYVGEAEEGEYSGPGAWQEPEVEGEIEAERESLVSVPSAISVVISEETEEERAARIEKEYWIDQLKQKIADRTMLKRKNFYLQKKLVEHFRKRRMDHVLKEDSKGLDLETKYLKRLYAFQDFKKTQEEQIEELSQSMKKSKEEVDHLKEEVEDHLNKFIQREKDFSSTLIATKTGRKLNEKVVERLLKREIAKSEEKGKFRLKFIKIKHLIEEKESQLKAMECFGEGLHMMDYEQLKIDNQNYTDKIEEKEDELARLRTKTHGNVQNLAHVREKAYAIEGDIEIMEEKFYEVDSRFNETREKLTIAKKLRDNLRAEHLRLKGISGLLANNRLLRDFENSIKEAEAVSKQLEFMRNLIAEKKKKELELSKVVTKPIISYQQFKFPFEIELERKKTSGAEKKIRKDSTAADPGMKKKAN